MSASRNPSNGVHCGEDTAAVLRGCPNQKASEMVVCKPWSFTPNIPAYAQRDKASFRTWAAEVTTEHLFYSASEGVCPNLRVNKTTNPLRRLHGLIADYDTSITFEMIESQLATWPSEDLPNWISRTFSGGARIVWLFQEPIPIENEKLLDSFLTLIGQELRVEKFLPALDKGAWNKPSQIFEAGKDWRQIAQSPLPTQRLFELLVRAAKKIRWESDGPLLPLEVVAGWVEEDFPGRWNGAFEDGKRGCAFFDADSTNPTAAIVVPAGMICFSQAKSFYSWKDIFPKRVRKYNEERIGGATAGTFYDGRKYWRKDHRGIFIPQSKEDFVIKLKVQHRLRADKMPWEIYSEVDEALFFIQEQRRVDGAIPLLYEPNDIVYTNGKRFVNASTVKIVQPGETPQEWKENFPWLAQFFEECFDKELVACVVEGQPPALAKEIFLAWFKRFYCSGLQGRLVKGQGLFLVGPANSGKTLLGVRIVGAAMGGHSEASDFLGGGSNFNRELIEPPVWNIDDGVMNSAPGGHQKFSEIIKRTVANPYFSYHPKFHDQQRAEWLGRVIVTLNADASSVRMIPNLDASLEDKIIVLKFSDQKLTFPRDVEAIITRELPFFLRWLVDWQVPAHILGESRFGIKAFIHEDVRAAAICSGDTGDILEIVDLWIQYHGEDLRAANGTRWHGTATKWMATVAFDDRLRPLVTKFNARTIGRRFSDASRIRGTRVILDPSKAKLNGNRYFISLAEDTPRQQGKTVRFRPELPEIPAGEQQVA